MHVRDVFGKALIKKTTNSEGREHASDHRKYRKTNSVVPTHKNQIQIVKEEKINTPSIFEILERPVHKELHHFRTNRIKNTQRQALMKLIHKELFKLSPFDRWLQKDLQNDEVQNNITEEEHLDYHSQMINATQHEEDHSFQLETSQEIEKEVAQSYETSKIPGSKPNRDKKSLSAMDSDDESEEMLGNSVEFSPEQKVIANIHHFSADELVSILEVGLSHPVQGYSHSNIH